MGASIAIVVSVLLEAYIESAINPGQTATSFVTVAVVAPVVEEAAKGMFLLIMMTGRRRNELNSLTDCLVYAGVVAVGFAWLEDIFYIADGETLASSLVTAAMRLIMGPFAHPLFTTFTGVGVYFALQQRNTLAKVGYVVLGYLAAVVMHGLWNGSALVGVQAYFGVYVAWMMPIFGLAIAPLAVGSRRREQRIVAEKLPGMVAAGLVTPQEAGWLGSIGTRKAGGGRGASVRRAGRRRRGPEVRGPGDRLAFVRDRIDRGFGDERVFALQTEEAYGVRGARGRVPLAAVAGGYRPPPPGSNAPPPLGGDPCAAGAARRRLMTALSQLRPKPPTLTSSGTSGG